LDIQCFAERAQQDPVAGCDMTVKNLDPAQAAICNGASVIKAFEIRI
jgi:hypothetical protein